VDAVKKKAEIKRTMGKGRPAAVIEEIARERKAFRLMSGKISKFQKRVFLIILASSGSYLTESTERKGIKCKYEEIQQSRSPREKKLGSKGRSTKAL